jgi:AraC family transcriptional regulator
LSAGRTPLAELALELGYSDQSHFTREFKRETGWTPSRFRATASSLDRLR